MCEIKEFFQSLVKAGTIPQEPMNYDAATLKIYIDHLEAENATLRERLENAVELPCMGKLEIVDDNDKHLKYIYFIYYKENGKFSSIKYLNKKAALARLAELKGEKE